MSKTILLVDDDKSLGRLYQELLPREGFAVLCERDGEWALNTFNQRPVDVVLLDVLVPVLNGFQVAERIRQTEKGKGVPIIFMSGVYKAQNHREAVRQKYGALEFLEKPFEAQRLVGLLKQALGADYPRREEREAEAERLEKKAAAMADEETKHEASEVESEAQSSFKGGGARGNFKTKPYTEIVAELYRWRSTGALLMRHDKVKKIVYFKEGHPIFIKSNLLSECLGKVMVRERMITEKECEDSLKKMKDSGRQQGTILIEMGCISPHNLKYALQLQLETKLFDVFGWTEGDWQFNPKAEVPSAITTLEMTPAQMIYEGVRRSYDAQRVRDALGAVDAFLAAPSADPLLRFQDIGMEPEETHLWETIDGKRTVRELVESGALPEEDAYKFVYAMKCAQMIELVPVGTRIEAEPPPAPEVEKPPAAPVFDEPTVQAELPEEVKQALMPVAMKGAYQRDDDATPIEPSPPVLDETGPRASPLAALFEVPAPTVPAAAPLASLLGMPAQAPPSPPSPLWGEGKGGGAPAPVPPPAPLASLLSAPPPSPAAGPLPLASLLSDVPVPETALRAPPPLPLLETARSRSEEQQARDKLVAKMGDLQSKNFYEVLGVEVDSSREQIKRAYFALSKEYHPDKHFSAASADLRGLATEVYELITHAYEVLSDPDARERYRLTLPEEQREKQGVDPMSAILAAEGKFQKGEELLRSKQFGAAFDQFKEAARLYPEEGEFHAFLGWSLFQSDPENRTVVQQSVDHLERAIALNPKVDKAYYFLGQIYKVSGRKDKAEKQFEKAIRANPDNKDALQELKLLAR